MSFLFFLFLHKTLSIVLYKKRIQDEAKKSKPVDSKPPVPVFIEYFRTTKNMKAKEKDIQVCVKDEACP